MLVWIGVELELIHIPIHINTCGMSKQAHGVCTMSHVPEFIFHAESSYVNVNAGIEIYCAPTVDCMPTWLSSMTHIALEGGCFVLSACQFCRRKNYPPPPEYTFCGLEEEPSPESVVCSGGSVIISPLGTVLAGPNYESEALLTADLGKVPGN